MDQLDIAMHSTAHDAPGGLPKLANKLGVGETVLRSKCNPNTDTHKLSLREALAMMLLTDDVRILEVMADQLGYKLEPVETRAADSVLDAVLLLGSSVGEVNRTIQEALADNRISARELADIRNRSHLAMNELRTLITTVSEFAKVAKL